MLKTIDVQGRTEDEAIEKALEQLGLSRDDVSVEIIEVAKSGLFGRKPAVVRVEFEADDALPQENAEVVRTVTEQEEVKSAANVTDSKKTFDSAKIGIGSAPADSEVCDKVDTYLKGLFKLMDIDVSFDITDKGGAVNVVLKSADPGVLIGRRGETLDALQHLANYSLNRSPAGRTRIQLDAENYRQRRSESLESLAARTASKVIKYRRNMTLDPMNAYERHIIHSALQDNDQVTTFSVGNDFNRRVVIAYGKDAGDRQGSPQYKEWH